MTYFGSNEYEQEKMGEFLNDITLEGNSNCCGAGVLEPDICTSCGEHCGIVKEPI